MEHPDPERRWKNRRRMAWLCTFASIAYPLIALGLDKPDVLASIAGPFYLFNGAVVGAYIGFSTWDDK